MTKVEKAVPQFSNATAKLDEIRLGKQQIDGKLVTRSSHLVNRDIVGTGSISSVPVANSCALPPPYFDRVALTSSTAMASCGGCSGSSDYCRARNTPHW
jgi:hypothetical protein